MIEIVYALPQKQWIVTIPFVDGMTARDAVGRSGLPEAHAEIATRPLVLGLFGNVIGQQHVLKDGDRVEICRPLHLDPREMRRRAVAAGRHMGQRAGNRSETS